jgi:hypothetical protein
MNLAYLGASTGTNTSALDLKYSVSSLISRKNKKEKDTQRSEIINTNIFHINRDIVFVRQCVRRRLYERIFGYNTLCHFVQGSL